MTNQISLSICMMVKDEEKNLGRCLDSIKPLLAKPDVELIIVDTGSSDGTVNIASQYTSKVFFHRWANDFSAMRNTTISYAKGKFVFILDADEVLLEPDRLYGILMDKKSQSSGVFTLKIKSYTSMTGDFSVISQERVFRNDGYFRYKGEVHNQAVYKGETYDTDIYIDHYGYLFQDKELKEKKFLRTGNLLKESISKHPNEPYYRFQMSRTYRSHGDRKEALDEIREAYRLIAGKTDRMMERRYIYGTYADTAFVNREYEETLRVCDEGLSVSNDYLDLYFLKAYTFVRLGNKTRAVEVFTQYIDLAGRYNELPISTNPSIEMIYSEEKYQDEALIYLANDCFNNGEYEEAYGYVERVHDKKIKVNSLLKILLRLCRYDEIKGLYAENTEDKKIRDGIIMVVEQEKELLTEDQAKEIEKQFYEGEDLYSLLNRVRNAEGESRQQLVRKALKLADLTELPPFYAELFLDIDENMRQYYPSLKTLGKTAVRNYIQHMLNKKESLIGFFEGHLQKEIARGDDYHALRLYISMAYVLLVREAATIRGGGLPVSEKYYSLFKAYMDAGISYIKLVYNFERLRLYYATLEDAEERFFIGMHYASEAVARKDHKAGIKYFLAAAKANPYMACYVKLYKNVLFPNMKDVSLDEEQEGMNGEFVARRSNTVHQIAD